MRNKKELFSVTMKNRITVKILGQEYTVVSDETREYIEDLASLVDEKMVELADKNKNFSKGMVAVLSALHMCDEYLKIHKEYEKLKTEHGEPIEDLQKTKELLIATMEEAKKYKSDNSNIRDDYTNLESSYKDVEQRYLELKEEINNLSQESEAKNNKLIKADKMIEDLRSKLLQSEVKLVQTKKELQEFIEAFS